MAGHSQFKNIMHRKGAQDAKRAKIFMKITREITVSVKESGSADPENNARLRSALIAAREANMPRDNIDRAIKKSLGADDGADFQEIRYEGYGPNGVAVIVEALTDNRNRTGSEVRATFVKNGGNLGESNSVSFQFDKVGFIRYKSSVASAEDMFEAALEAGADDAILTEEDHEIYCEMSQLGAVRDSLIKKYGEPEAARIIWKPKNTIMVSAEQAKTLLKMIDILEDNDDVQSVTTNAEFPDELLEEMSK